MGTIGLSVAGSIGVAGVDDQQRRIDDIADILLTACEGPRGQLHPWHVAVLFGVSQRCFLAARDPSRGEVYVAKIIHGAVRDGQLKPWQSIGLRAVAERITMLANAPKPRRLPGPRYSKRLDC